MSTTISRCRLLADVCSIMKKGTLYGSRLDIVTIIADRDPVLIVEGKNKVRFSVVKNKVQLL
jgi:hypothetical protein